uniref:Transmembrane protein n=1 Tax=Amaranthus palmeri TaxID=107608 RepID=A0A6C0T519_AMAPA|nr:hypothetical protein AP_R.00g000390-v1.0.a3 [Amaranthus palmeri]
MGLFEIMVFSNGVLLLEVILVLLIDGCRLLFRGGRGVFVFRGFRVLVFLAFLGVCISSLWCSNLLVLVFFEKRCA